MPQDSFLKRFLIIFIPLSLFFIAMRLAGITDNIGMTIILSLAFTWMVQAIYKRVLMKRMQKYEEEQAKKR